MTTEHKDFLTLSFYKSLQLAFPPVLVHVLQELLKPSPSFKSISEYLRMDPMLTSQILHIVNASSYGFSKRIIDLERAVIAIGTNELLKLIISLSLQKRLTPKNAREAELDFGDWRITLWSAIAAEALCSSICPAQKQEAYLAGMLKDLPLYLALCREDAASFATPSGLITLPWPGQATDELRFWGYSHPELAHNILLYWGLPIELADAVRHHHDFAGRAALSRLSQILIFATRWSELLHDPHADPAQIVSFELTMAAEFDLGREEAEHLRASCAAKFNLRLSQLGIPQDPQAYTPVHNQSLPEIQRAYFLALGALSESAPLTPRSLAGTLGRYLRLFWNRTAFSLVLKLPGDEQGAAFRALPDATLAESTDIPEPLPRSGRLRVPLAGKSREYGFLALPQDSDRSTDTASLVMFARAIGMQLDALFPQQPPARTMRGERTRLAALYGGLMETLLKTLHINGCLLDRQGVVIWADSPQRRMIGKSIFTLSEPESPLQERWGPAFLDSLDGAVTVRALLAGGGRRTLRELQFVPHRQGQQSLYIVLVTPLPA
jgi:HD-like signal output (HDOD) protein